MNVITSLRRFQEEAKKTNRISQQILSELLALKVTANFTTPISDPNSPFPVFFKESVQISRKLNGLMILLMASNAFSGEALAVIENSFLEVIMDYDPDPAIRLLQVNATLLLDNYDCIEVVAAMFSVSLSLIAHKVSLVSATAFASTQQMISSLFEKANKSENRAMVEVKGKPEKIEKRSVGAWVLIHDLALLIQGKEAEFLRVKGLIHRQMYELWEMVLSVNAKFIMSCSPLLAAVSSTMVLPVTTDNFSCFVAFICRYEAGMESDCSGENVLNDIIDSKLDDLSLALLRTVFLENTNMATLVNVATLRKLLKVLNDNFHADTSKPIRLSFGSESSKRKGNVQEIAVEMGVVIVAHISKDVDLQEAWEFLVLILIKGIRVCHRDMCDIVFKAYTSLLMMLYQSTELSAIMIRILCSLVAKQPLTRKFSHPLETMANELLHRNVEGFGFKAKRAMAYYSICSMLDDNPSVFDGLYTRLFLSLSLYPHAAITAGFTKRLTPEQLALLSDVLIQGTTFSLNFLSSLIEVNKDRLSVVWEVIGPSLPEVIRNEKFRELGLNILFSVISDGFNESQICVLSTVIEMLDNKKRIAALEHLRSALQHNASKIDKSWGDVLSIISPSRVGVDLDMLSAAFACLHIICSSYFQRLGEVEMQKCISILFEFAVQTTDINISLSSLGLLWDITPCIYQLSRFWKRILSETLVFFNDSRQDVATCALKTFFSLLASNTQIPLDVYDHLIANCFIPLLMTFTNARPEWWSVQQLALQLICHCACSFWDKFQDNPQFLSNFWTLLIEKQQDFMMNCINQELLVSGLQFYETAFGCEQFDAMLRESLLTNFSKTVSWFFDIRKEMTLVLSTIGRFFVTILPTQKPHLTQTLLSLWLLAVKSMVSPVTSLTKVTLTAQKGIEAACLLFPIERQLGCMIWRMLTDLILQTENATLRLCAVDHLSRILTTGIPREEALLYVSECKQIFSLSEATDLLETVLKYDFGLKTEDFDLFFKVMESIRNSAPQFFSAASEKVIHVLPLVDVSLQGHFIEEVRTQLDLLSLIWETYGENGIHKGFVDSWSTKLLGYIFKHLEGDETQVLRVLAFLQSSRCYEKSIGNNSKCVRWHLFAAVPFLFPLVDSQIPSIATESRKCLQMLQMEMKQMID